MILNIVGTCTDYGIISLIHILKNILNLIQIIGPILLIISLTIIIVKYVQDPENKKLKNKIKNSIIALILVFLVPAIINGFIYILDDSFEFSTCWNYADKEVKLSSKYYNTYDIDPSKITNDKKDYEKGDKRKEENNPNSNNKSNINQPNTNISKRIFVGDSRTVQMYAYLTGDWNNANYSSGGVHKVGDDIIIAQGSMGLAWMKSTGIPEATKYMSNGTALIILMGVNDLYNLNEYLNYINTNYSNWTSKGVNVYFTSVNPCTGNYANLLNNKIVSFNNGIKKGLNPNIRYIDSHSNLISTGYNTTDGLHYDKKTSDKIYNYVKNNV